MGQLMAAPGRITFAQGLELRLALRSTAKARESIPLM